jgi:hypothetical protein
VCYTAGANQVFADILDALLVQGGVLAAINVSFVLAVTTTAAR